MRQDEHPHFSRWRTLIQRCENPNNKRFHDYGGRGIYVCKKWRKSFETFAAWCDATYEPGKSLDRINNDGPYSPQNCRWATASEQQRNRRRGTPAQARATVARVQGWVKHLRSIYGDPDSRDVKHCPGCRSWVPVTGFKANSTARDGRDSYCLPCRRAYDREYARARRDRHP